jgi:hypothetical protein
VLPLKYELGFCMPGDGIVLSHRRENLLLCSLMFDDLRCKKLLGVKQVHCSSLLL